MTWGSECVYSGNVNKALVNWSKTGTKYRWFEIGGIENPMQVEKKTSNAKWSANDPDEETWKLLSNEFERLAKIEDMTRYSTVQCSDIDK